MKMFNLFKRKKTQPQVVKKQKQRAFKAARSSRFTEWIFGSFGKINLDLQSDLTKLIQRCRDLAKNNELMRSHLHNMDKSIIGDPGFRLQSLVKNADGELDEAVNRELEYAWWNFGKRSNGYITTDGQLGDKDLDSLILRTLLIDGEVFIRIYRNARNPYGLSFKVLDSLCIDYMRERPGNEDQNAIFMGIEVDKNGKPVNYYFNPGDHTQYFVGKSQIVPAEDIIHIYKHEFTDQLRGFPEICASIDSLKQIDDYALAELLAAKAASCQSLFYERNSDPTAGDWMNQSEQEQTEEDNGTFVKEMTPFEASIVPKGYNVKAVSPTHPNTNFGGFVKAIVRRIASSVGVSYNRLSHDYEAVNYSSLREASIDEGKTYSALQRFLIENWKEIEYTLFVKQYILLNAETRLRPSMIDKYINDHQFIGNKSDYFDPAKEIISIERKLKLGLTNPIIEMEKHGIDYEEVLDGWTIWNKLCEQRKLNFNLEQTTPLDVVGQMNQEANHPQDENNAEQE